jgi:hypothetical protein
LSEDFEEIEIDENDVESDDEETVNKGKAKK